MVSLFVTIFKLCFLHYVENEENFRVLHLIFDVLDIVISTE